MSEMLEYIKAITVIFNILVFGACLIGVFAMGFDDEALIPGLIGLFSILNLYFIIFGAKNPMGSFAKRLAAKQELELLKTQQQILQTQQQIKEMKDV